MNKIDKYMVSNPRLLVFLLTLLVILPMLATDVYLPALPFPSGKFIDESSECDANSVSIYDRLL